MHVGSRSIVDTSWEFWLGASGSSSMSVDTKAGTQPTGSRGRSASAGRVGQLSQGLPERARPSGRSIIA
jgi:hypothetical protein